MLTEQEQLEQIRKNIKILCIAYNKNLTRIQEETGISKAALSRVNKCLWLKTDFYYKIAKMFDIDLVELFGSTDELARKYNM